jgi:hypothetical protein
MILAFGQARTCHFLDDSLGHMILAFGQARTCHFLDDSLPHNALRISNRLDSSSMDNNM